MKTILYSHYLEIGFFSLNHDKPNEIDFWSNAQGKITDWIVFRNITRMVYSNHREVLAIESVTENFFSDMLIKASGIFSLGISKSMKLYSTSFCSMLSDEKSVV
jgi:hypothetical protein